MTIPQLLPWQAFARAALLHSCGLHRGDMGTLDPSFKSKLAFIPARKAIDRMQSVPFCDLSSMRFDVSKEQEDFLSKVKHACSEVRDSEEMCYLTENRNENIVPVFSQIGMLGCPISSEFGGLGYDMLTYCLALEIVGEQGSSLRTFFSAHTSIGQLVIQSWGTEQQRSRLLPPTTSGEKIMAFALTEPAAGSDPASMVTRYERRGDNYVLNGKKHWIGNGTFAKIMTTYAKDPVSGKISAFAIERDGTDGSDGLQTSEMKNKMGLLTVKNAEIHFKDCLVPSENLLGKEGQGLSIAYSALIDGRLSVAAGAIGVMRDCLAEVIRYSKQRSQHGSPLAKKQLIQQHVCQIATNIETSRWLVYRAAAAVQKLHSYVEKLRQDCSDYTKWLGMLSRSNSQYLELRAQADYLSSVAKFHASNCSFDSANRAVQVFGSAGYTKSARVARHFLDSRATIIYEGANEVLELKIASSNLGEGYNAL